MTDRLIVRGGYHNHYLDIIFNEHSINYHQL
jgi:hypothetical protein